MTTEEVAKAMFNATLMELAFFYQNSGQTLQRYDNLRLTLVRMWADQCDDSEFLKFCMDRNGAFRQALADSEALKRASKLMVSDEMVTALKEVQKKAE